MNDIQRCLNGGVIGDSLSVNLMKGAVPPGWHFFIDQVARFQALVTQSNERCDITSLKIEKGLLRIAGSCSHSIDQVLFARQMQAIARGSANTCMVCGKWGMRRAAEVGTPAFCGTHYIEYVNFLDTQGG